MRVPAQLMRAMAAEAEAAREARAKVSLMLMMTIMVVKAMMRPGDDDDYNDDHTDLR